jgi:wyosine [tRNA(Phe)-imidazoG37] synthetase (radical SAM superfamily)
VYCQLGRTKPLVNERAHYFPTEEILLQVEKALEAHKPGEIDWVTFVGSGEPTLYSGIGKMIREVKTLTDIPVAVITNGALFYLPEVREELLTADAVLPSLDAGTPALYRKINRPHPEITFGRHLSGLIAFSREYLGALWPEVMLIQGLNDYEQALRDLAKVFKKMAPDEVHINLPTRPPVETWVKASDDESVLRALAILGEAARVMHPVEGTFDLGEVENVVDAVIGIITRHPMREDQLMQTLSRWSADKVSQVLVDLVNDRRAQSIERYGIRFWCAKKSFYPDDAHSKKTSPDRWEKKHR